MLGDHFQPHEAQHRRQSVVQVAEAVDHAGQQEEQRPKPQDGEHVGTEGDEHRLRGSKRLGNDADHGRHAIDGEHHVGALDHQQGEEHRRDAQETVLAGEEVVAVLMMVAAGGPQEAPGHPQDGVVLRVDLHAAVPRQFIGGVDQERPKQRCHPIEAVDQLDPSQNEGQPHHDRPQNAPEEHAVLIHQRDGEEAKNHHEDEDVVHRERFFD